MPVPKGVSPQKYDSCVEQVKEKQGGEAEGKVNAYAVCAAQLKRGEGMEKDDKKGIDEAKVIPVKLKDDEKGGLGKSSLDWSDVEKSISDFNTGLKKANLGMKEMDFDKPGQEAQNLLEATKRPEREKVVESAGQKKEVNIYGDAQKKHKVYKSELESGMSFRDLQKYEKAEDLKKPKK